MFAVAKIIKAGSHICIEEKTSECAVSLGTLQKIPHGYLHMKKLAARWIPQKETDVQKLCGVDTACNLRAQSLKPNSPRRLTN